MINLILDVLIYNYTSYKSFFFLIDIGKRELLLNVFIGLFIDFFLTRTYVLTTIFIIIVFFISKAFKLNNNIGLTYYLFNIGVILLYYLLFSLNNYWSLEVCLNAFIINSIYIILSYKMIPSNINLFR